MNEAESDSVKASVVKCRHCSKEASPANKFCPSCGQLLPSRRRSSHPPTLNDYGLDQDTVAASREFTKRIDNQTVLAAIGVGSTALLGVFAIALVADGQWAPALFGTLCFGIPVATLFAVIVAAIGFVASPRLSPEYGNAQGVLSRFDEFEKSLKDYEREQRRRQRDYWTALAPFEFEKGIASIFIRLGMQATVTPRSGDKGIDIHLNDGHSRAVVQCKRHKSKASPAFARELYGTLVDDGAQVAVLVCTGGFTSGVREFVKDKPIYLVGIDDILRLVEIAGPVGLYEDEFTFDELFRAMRLPAPSKTPIVRQH